MRVRILLLCWWILGLPTASQAQAPITLNLQKVLEGLSGPVVLTHAGDGSNRLFLVEQPGNVRVVRNGKVKPYPFLDLTSKVAPISPYYSEMGLLGLAFHPKYKQNGRFYVYFSGPREKAGTDHQGILAEYQVSPFDPDMADFTTQRIILTVDQPASNHNGGALAFGPDGYLYLGLGDGGGAGDRFGLTGNGQNLNSLLGKILRIDVDRGEPYSIPDDNPFARGGGRPEIWAYGLRNPWRFSFAPDGRLFCADVGQNKWEEINLIERGGNYGWRLKEGNQCYNPEKNCEQGKTLEAPIHVYLHSSSRVCVVGGYVCRNRNMPALYGKFVFADWKGAVMALEQNGQRWESISLRFRSGDDYGYINSLGEDEQGNLYLLTQTQLGPKNRTGAVYLIQK
jgi:glucose/arabinose dehydrogenase